MRGAEVEEGTTAAGSLPHLDLVLHTILPVSIVHLASPFLDRVMIIQIVRPQILIIPQQVG